MPEVIDVRNVLEKTAFRKIDVDELFDPNKPSWVSFDSEIGYVPSAIVMQDGADGSWTTYRYEPEGHRKMINYADRPCRINTYGDSYTQCQQVNDGETWQEILAAHIGEPIRNFGCGGHSVNTACRRAKRMEATDCCAEYIIVNVFDDDHVRNLDATRWIRSAWYKEFPPDIPTQLHGLPWAHVRYNLETGRFEDHPGLCPDESAFRALADPEHFYNTFKDDEIVKLFTLIVGGEAEVEHLEALAEALDVEVDLRDPKTRSADAQKLHLAYGLKSSEYVLDDFKKWADQNNKKLMIHLSYGGHPVPQALVNGEPRFDQCFLDYLDRKGIPYVDTAAKFAEDYRRYDQTFEEYMRPFRVQAKVAAVFIHLTPKGNHFYAWAVNDEVVDWLDPKPPAYCGPKRVGSAGFALGGDITVPTG